METNNSTIHPDRPIRKPSSVLVFTSGKGGVGKTCISTNVALAMVQRGAKVCIFDADTGLANINILLGLRPEYTLEHVLSGEKTIAEVIINTTEGLAVVPSASGIAECANLDAESAKRLLEALATLEKVYDYLLIDTAAGIADNVIQFIESAQCVFLIITSEPTSLTDAFSLLKRLDSRLFNGKIRVLVNLSIDYAAAMEIYNRFIMAVNKYLELKHVNFGGFIVRDENVAKSVALQQPIVNLAPNSPACQCFYALADNLLKHIGAGEADSGFSAYWQDLFAKADSQRASSTEVPAVGNRQAPAVMSTAELALKLLSSLKNQDSDQDSLDQFSADFVTTYVEKFGSFPASFKQLFFRWLEADDYPALRMIELVATLEALYRSRHQQPMFSIEESTARLIAQNQGSQSQFSSVVRQLRSAYRQAFQVDVFDAQQELVDSILKDEFSEERFGLLLHNLQEAFQLRFNRPYQGQSDLLLESTAEALEKMTDEERQLQLDLQNLLGRFQQISAHRESLLGAIDHAKSNNPIDLC